MFSEEMKLALEDGKLIDACLFLLKDFLPSAETSKTLPQYAQV